MAIRQAHRRSWRATISGHDCIYKLEDMLRSPLLPFCMINHFGCALTVSIPRNIQWSLAILAILVVDTHSFHLVLMLERKSIRELRMLWGITRAIAVCEVHSEHGEHEEDIEPHRTCWGDMSLEKMVHELRPRCTGHLQK